jgi:WhiB family redox-sensing transcriptional regulator
MNWIEQSACKGASPSLFFPDKWDNQSVRSAKAVCANCPVRAECLEYAVAAVEPFGIWGGLTSKQRSKLRRPLVPVPLRRHPLIDLIMQTEDELRAS